MLRNDEQNEQRNETRKFCDAMAHVAPVRVKNAAATNLSFRERHTKVALNSVLTDAVLAGAIAANPVRELGTRRKRKADKKVQGAPALDVDQVRALLKEISEPKVCEGKDLRDPVIVLAATGMRR